MQESPKPQTVSALDMTLELQTERTKEAACARFNAYMNYNKIDKFDTNLAKTLAARDYKGFGTGFDTMNGIVECQKLGGLLGNHQATSVYSADGLSPTLMAGMDHGNTMPFIVEVDKNE